MESAIQAFLWDMEIFNKRTLLRLLNIDYFLNLFFHIQVDHTNPKFSKQFIFISTLNNYNCVKNSINIIFLVLIVIHMDDFSLISKMRNQMLMVNRIAECYRTYQLDHYIQWYRIRIEVSPHSFYIEFHFYFSFCHKI